MKYLSVCSGIEAATVAWHPIGWQPLAFSEIEKFPRQVLAYHYPDTPCHGDFTVLRDQDWIVDADLLVGGTPCQAFSVAGLRQSLSDDRGNLTLEFVRLADAIDNVRHDAARPPAIIVWENVPGVLSVKDNAFGCFLAALTGNDAPLIPTGGKWTNAGLVVGPKRSAAWRILDAQYFGVAQRRRRVFVVASARDGFDPAEILFEREGVRRDIAPSRSAGKGSARGIEIGPSGGNFTELNPTLDARAKDGPIRNQIAGAVLAARMVAFGEYVEDGTASAMKARDWKDATDLVAQPIGIILHGSDGTVNTASYTEVSNALLSRAPGGIQNSTTTAVMQPIAFDLAQITSATNRSRAESELPTGTLSSNSNMHVVQPIAFNSKDYGSDATTDMSPTLRSLGAYDANGGGSMAVAQPINIFGGNKRPDRPEGGFYVDMDAITSKTLDAASGLNPTAAQGGTAVMQPIVIRESGQGYWMEDDKAGTLRAEGEDRPSRPSHVIAQQMAVRRLTPRECERLQGFPDDYTAIPNAADGPRYKALGNSMAVPVMHWIGKRIQNYIEIKNGK